MATVGGLTNSTSNNIRGYGGLASGMDRDTLIEGMTYGTTSKITQQEQKKQQLEWKQNAVRAISDMMIAFANKYTDSYTSATNLFSSMFWGRNNITTSGAFSKFVNVTGTASAADAITIMGVKQLAQDAKWTSSEAVSDMKLQASNVVGNTLATNSEWSVGDDGYKSEYDGLYKDLKLSGKTIEFEYGGSSYSVSLGAVESDTQLYDYGSADKIADAINKQLKNVKVGEKNNLSEYVKFEAVGEKIQVTGTGDKTFKMTGGSALKALGFKTEGEDGKAKEWNLENAAVSDNDINMDDILGAKTFAEKVDGKTLTFSYNGTTKTIKMPTKDELQGSDADNLKKIKDSLQSSLDSAFGKGRIRVDTKDKKLSFITVDPSKADKKDVVDSKGNPGDLDKTSTLTLVSGHSDLVGPNGVLGIKAGASNRVNLNESLETAGLGIENGYFTNNTKDIYINGTKITIDKTKSVNDLIKTINESNAGVTLSYQAVGDKFTFTSKEKGASGAVKISVNEDGSTDSEADKAFLNELFGLGKKEDGTYDSIDKKGQDAIVAIKYKGSDEPVELHRDTNSFTVDGLSVSVKGTFGYKGEELDKDFEDPVEINAQVDTDKIVDSIKSMVEEYNKIIELVNKEVSTRPDRDYAPLTSEQKKELSESEIETWEEKAKSGLLYGDSDLRSLSSDLRFIISGGNMEALRAVGITTSTLYSDNGKLTLDENKLRAALETDPESVEKLFTSKAGTDADGNQTFNGIATNLKSVMDKYVKTLGSMETKGILIKKAGSTSSPMSLTENAFYKQLAEINKQISKLQTRLESERDRYIKQFTSLETLISQMNSQSSWLSQLGGY